MMGEPDRPVWMHVFGLTDVGQVRSVNQDNFLIADLSGNSGEAYRLDPVLQAEGEAAPGRFSVTDSGAILLVADGMGGAAAGGLASEIAVAGIVESLGVTWGAERARTPTRFASRLREAVEAANHRIKTVASEHAEYSGMGTTATLGGVVDGFLFLAQVGDSRAYLVRQGTAHLMTRDQSIVQQMVDSGAMAADEAETSRHRHLLAQALGVNDSVNVDLTYQELRRGDVLVLCSDGLSGLVSPEHIAEAVSGVGPSQACAALVASANAQGGKDNITVLVAHMDGDGLAPPGEADTVRRQVIEQPAP